MPPFERTKLRETVETGREICQYLVSLYDDNSEVYDEEEEGSCLRVFSAIEHELFVNSKSLLDFTSSLEKRVGRKIRLPIHGFSEDSSTAQPDIGLQFDMTVSEFYEYMRSTYKSYISRGTVTRIIKVSKIEKTGMRRVGKANAPTYSSLALIEAGTKYASDNGFIQRSQ